MCSGKNLFTLAIATLFAMPAMAGIANGVSGNASSGIELNGNYGNGGFGSDSGLGIVLGGPAEHAYVPAEESGAKGLQGDSHSKSLLAFSDNNWKHGDWDWDHDWDWDWGWDNGNGNDCGNVVPEPASIALMGLGISALAVRKRNARKK